MDHIYVIEWQWAYCNKTVWNKVRKYARYGDAIYEKDKRNRLTNAPITSYNAILKVPSRSSVDIPIGHPSFSEGYLGDEENIYAPHKWPVEHGDIQIPEHLVGVLRVLGFQLYDLTTFRCGYE